MVKAFYLSENEPFPNNTLPVLYYENVLQDELGETYSADVVLLPAGTAHKKLDATENFELVGAYPSNGENFDMQYGEASDYEAIKETISKVETPLTDPVTNSPKDINEFWQ